MIGKKVIEMNLTIEELYIFKEEYQKQAEEALRKVEVVKEFIAYAEAKTVNETEVTSDEVELEVEATENTAETQF
jgi:hypothetical protein